jgi:hypothetical protein
MSQMKTGIAIASAAAALFALGATATVAQAADAPTVKCAGINSCKGSSDCKTAKNDCKGHNACKGQGWNTTASAKACTDAGGKVVK